VEPSFEALSRSYDFVIVAAGEIVGPDLEAIAAIAPQAVLVADTLTSAGIAQARERLLDAGFEDVTVVAEGKAAGFEPTAAAA
jgi:ABC-type Fe3+-hydroxamate transport system substrate-binding protein